MSFKKSPFLIAILCSSFLIGVGQTDSINSRSKKISFLVGTCATLQLYQRYESPLPSQTPSEKIPATYFGPTFSIYYNNSKTKNFMFQSGIEYTYAKYYVSSFTEGGTSKYIDNYSSMKFVVNTITIPAYFNLLLLNQRAYIGVGPNFDICPYTIGNGYKNYNTQLKINERFYSHLIDIGASAKIGLKIKFGKGYLTFESRLKSGFVSIFTGGTVLINQYCSLSTGYTF